MRQVVFVKQNEKKWKKIENHLRGYKLLTTDELAHYYIEIIDDLSYAKTFYPDSNIVDHLNQLAFGLHNLVYKNKKAEKGKLARFFLQEIPLIVYQYRQSFFLSLTAFFLAIFIGVFSAANDGDFVRLILGDSYVNRTLEYIEDGDPMAIYKSGGESSMFVGIGMNNIKVSFLAFVIGIFTSFFTGLIIFSNGIMVGAFVYFFVEKGLFVLSFTTIMIHGTLELSAIVIAGAAGIILGNSWMFPGTYSRMYSLSRTAREAVKIIIGLIPVFVIAAFLEGYVTRHYLELGLPGRLLIIVASTAYLLWYFVYLPYQVGTKVEMTYIQGETKLLDV